MFRLLPVILSVFAFGYPSLGRAQQFPTTAGTLDVEYQYQLHYQRPWLGYPGPGLSLGGTLPEQGRDGISSFYGLPFPAPLGTGVYVNNPFVYGHTAVQPQWSGPGPAWFPGPFAPYADPWNASRTKRSIAPVATHGNARPSRRLVSPTAAQVDAAQPVIQSSVEASDRSLEQQAYGDEKLRQQKWSQACMNYRQSVDVAEDRAPAHLRLGFAYTAMRHFTLAVREFKRGLTLDPTLPQSGDRLATIFGPDSKAARKSIQHQIATWVREDVHDPDRLFLLGLWLHYDDDPRGREVLEAALSRAGEGDHIVALLTPSAEPLRDVEQARLAIAPDLPALHAVPVPLREDASSPLQPDSSPPSGNLPPAPLPTPDDED
ncbi:MAG: hypothetical protein AABP62_04295 [Planctomycetota bacterium]